MFRVRRRFAVTTFVLALTVVAATAGFAAAKDNDQGTLLEYARDTWHSFEAMVDEDTGLPSDQISAQGVPVAYTSPTNIGSYLWSTIVARDLKIIKPREARARVAETLATLGELERSHGQFYNWYDPATGTRLRTWPTDGNPVFGFLSTVDNGWLATALHIVARAVPQSADEARALLAEMDFGFYYNPSEGQLRGGAWTEEPPGCSVPTTVDGEATWFTCHHYGTLNTEPRISSYLGIAAGDVPPEHYYRMFRTFPSTCDWSWQEQQPTGVTRTYLGVNVFEGTYDYRGIRLVPSWGGSMFEALMVPLFIPEEEWAPRSWGVNHPLYVEAQIEHGLEEAGYGYWGFSPSNDPAGGYREYGVDLIGLNPDGYTSDHERTTVDEGFADCRPAQPLPTEYGQGTVTPHASFLALDFDREAALENLANIRRDFPGAYGEFGFADAINVVSGQVAGARLSLDQGMVMAAIGNELTGDRLQRYLVRGEIERAIEPLIAPEVFGSGRDG